MSKKYIVIGGVNGAGKTTLREKYNIDAFVVDVDSLARVKLNGYKKAVKIATDTIDKYFSLGMSFGQESTLCGHSILKNIMRAKDLGYEVILLYVGVESEDIAVERVKQRVSKGGHDIPEQDIRRRYYLSLDVVKKYKDIFSSISFFDNSGIKHEHIAEYVNGELLMFTDKKYGWLSRIFDNR